MHIIYMPEGEVHMMEKMHQLDSDIDDLSYVKRMERDNVQKRLKMLFNPDESQA